MSAHVEVSVAGWWAGVLHPMENPDQLITLLLVVVWLLATPNGPFSSRPVVIPAPTISNGLNPFDVELDSHKPPVQ